MHPKNYFDIQLLSAPRNTETTTGPSHASHRLGALWKSVHRLSAHHHIPFAVAFPHWMQKRGAPGFGDVLRIFTETPESGTKMHDNLMSESDYSCVLSPVFHAPPDEAIQGWEAFMMLRLPSGVSKTRKSIPLDQAIALQKQAWERRALDLKGKPYVLMMASSSGQRFRLTVDRQVLTGTSSGGGEPNGYGLSRATQTIALPCLPDNR
ncbi:type I-F CRISPR-associated endoribonuclease Cas6/Csy4 [Acidithiobacillus marinus]|nr:type I-F CRISPR-associated endoribonuclease Cas6/Csy4 [Acidithiobacillus marinus]